MEKMFKFTTLKMFTNSCLSLSQKESTLYLKNPKLLSDTLRLSNSHEIETEYTQFFNIPSHNLKNEKRNKAVSKDFAFAEAKKGKSRHKKKAKINFNKNSSSISNDPELNNPKNSFIFRGHKSLRAKKNSRKNMGDNANSVQSHQQTSDLDNIAKKLYLNSLLTIKELAIKLNVPSADIVKWLFLQGISATINQVLDLSVLTLIAKHYSFVIVKQEEKNSLNIRDNKKPANGRLRAPVIVLLGHADHGKTSLLQAIVSNYDSSRQKLSNITQSIGSYEILVNNYSNIKKIIFLDTPGHEAFVSMRTRNINIADLAILVVSADDGLKSQTIEAINHIKARNLPFLVVINKVDKPEACVDKVKDQLATYDIYDRNTDNVDFMIQVSAATGHNIDLLLSTIIDLSISKQFRSDPLQTAEGIVLEAGLSKKKGPVAQLLIQSGTMRLGDIVVAGNIYGRVKAITNSLSQKVSSIESTSLAEVLCFASVPLVGLKFNTVNNEKMAKSLVAQSSVSNDFTGVLNTRVFLNKNNAQDSRRFVKQVNIVIKTDKQGFISPIVYALSQIRQEKVKINLLSAASGPISLKDIQFASTSGSIILAFNLAISSHIAQNAEDANIVIQSFNVIYDLIDYVTNYMLAFVEVDYRKHVLGHAIVKNLFLVNQSSVAGCLILDGKLKRQAYFDLKRANSIVHTGVIDSVRRTKDDVDEVLAGNECGIVCKSYCSWEVDDSLEIYELQPLEKVL